MNKGKTAFLISIQFLFILFVVIACQKTASITDSIEVENSISAISSSIVTPKPKETVTPTVNAATQTAIAWDATSDAFFLTSKANTMDRKTAVVKTFSAKDILCKSGYQINPAQNDIGVIDFYKTDTDSWTILSCYNEEDPSKIYTEIINYDNSKHFTFSQDDLNFSPMHFLTVFIVKE